MMMHHHHHHPQHIPRRLDANGAMDLSHVSARPNLTFMQFDLFDPSAKRTIQTIVDQARVCIAIGTHLCGALSPRLIDVAASVRGIDGLILSPCCLKGTLGSQITKQAKRRSMQPYPLAVSTLAELCRRELELPLDERPPASVTPPASITPAASVTSDAADISDATQPAGCGRVDSVADGMCASSKNGSEHAPSIRGSPPTPHAQVDTATSSSSAAAAAASATSASADVVAGARGGGPRVRVVYDADVLSPKNAFIVALTASRDRVHAEQRTVGVRASAG